MKRKYTSLFLSIVIILISIFFIYNSNYKTYSYKEVTNDKYISMFLETTANSGEYLPSNTGSWPVGYKFNTKLSYCENGTEIIYNEETDSVTININKTDKCYFYFDALPDLNIQLANVGASSNANMSCSVGNATYNPINGDIEVSSMPNGKLNCTLTFLSAGGAKDYLNSKIINNAIERSAVTSKMTSAIVHENGYRYEGKDPDNYISFNNELWRIIGVFDSETHGISGKNLVKIIGPQLEGIYHPSNAGITTADWANTNGTPASYINIFLNGAYYDWETNKSTVDNYCQYMFEVPANCDFSNSGIKSVYRSYIKTVKWKIGKLSTTSTDANYYGTSIANLYTLERSGNEFEAKIGLIYPTDYGYSVLDRTNCASNITEYSNASCFLNSWISNDIYGGIWALNDAASGYYHFAIGVVPYTPFILDAVGVVPVLYLDENVYVTSGTGTKTNPYILNK